MITIIKQNLERFKTRFFDNQIKLMADVVFSKIEENYAVVIYHGYNKREEVNLSKGLLLQSTGLRDKNKKLIFEGDIVLIEGIKYIIGWSDDNASFVARCQEPNRPDYDIYGLVDVEMEVLGNSFENADILNNNN